MSVHDNNPLPSIAYARWKDMTWQEAVEEAATLFHLAVKLDEVRNLEAKRTKQFRWKGTRLNQITKENNGKSCVGTP